MLALFAYNIAIQLYRAAIVVCGLFNTKAAKWAAGRKEFPTFENLHGFKVWFHCASLGEFEQARPLLEKIKLQHPNCSIVLSFFSPSGYEVRKNYEYADKVVYLPLDTQANAAKFIEALKPNLVFFVKYEFWFHYLNELQKQNIPTILFSAIFRKEQHFFQWYGGFFRGMLQKFTQVFVQDEESQRLLKGVGVPSIVANDTRFDRVTTIAQQKTEFPLIAAFKGSSRLLIAGSTWQSDDELILTCITRDVLRECKYIIAPHELKPEALNALKNRIPVKALLYAELTNDNATHTDVVIIDNYGMLASLYAYCEIAYVGGGFNASVHNVLEAAVYGVPVIFGPNYQKSAEAKELVKQQGAFVVNNGNELGTLLIELEKGDNRKTAGSTSGKYVKSHLGGTEAIYSYMVSNINLP